MKVRTDAPQHPAPARVEEPPAPVPAALTPARVLALQRTAGNASVAAYLARQPAAAPVCAPRDPGEVERSRQPGGILGGDDTEYVESPPALHIRDFAVSRSQPPAGIEQTPAWQRAVSMMLGDPTMVVAVGGMTDCAGDPMENYNLRVARANAIRAAFPAPLRARILFIGADGPSYASDATADGRARNRAVKVTWQTNAPRGRDAADMLTQASTLDEYLFLIRSLESRLGLTGAGNARTAISVARQLYYGSAAWANSQNAVWDSVIPDHPWSPGQDPSPRLGPSLMAALKASQVVEGIDIGHVLTGIDAMLRPGEVDLRLGRVTIGTGLMNEEWATWAGDVGSAAATWALDEWGRVPTRHPHFADYFRDLAGTDDLLGNIDAFAIRAGMTGTAGPAELGTRLNPTLSLSEILMQYYRISRGPLGDARRHRIRNFVTAYGATATGGTIADPQALRTRLRPSVETFAGLFFLRESLGRGYLGDHAPPPPRPGEPDPQQRLQIGIDQATHLFVDWLQTQLTAEGP